MHEEIELTGGPSAAHAARVAVDSFVERLPDPLPEATIDDLKLLVSELVTNSVRHGGVTERGVVSLRLSYRGGTIRSEIEAPGPPFAPPRPESAPDRTSGFGLVLVANLSRCWGVEGADASRVWFEIGVPRMRRRARRRRDDAAPVLAPA